MRLPWGTLSVVAVGCLLGGCVGIQTLGPADLAASPARLPALSGKAGVYRGSFTLPLPAGAFAAFRSFTVEVHVQAGRMTAIDLIQPEVMRTAEFFLELPTRIVETQSLDVDVISGVTYSSLAFKKAVERALAD